MVEHKLIAFEPIWKKFYLKPDGEVLVPDESLDESPIESLMDEAEYECTCGKEFDNYVKATEHIWEV